MNFQVKRYALPHDGIIPGARGHKKNVIPTGTKVYCIVHGVLFFWAAYLDEPTALQVAKSLEETLVGRGRNKRPMELKTMLAWNFKNDIPKRITRPKKEDSMLGVNC